MATCVFCGGSSVTKEHIFGAWLQKLIPAGGNRLTQRFDATAVGEEAPGRNLVIRAPAFRELGRSAASWQVFVPCGECNSGWMSRIQNDAKGALVPLIYGQSLTLSPRLQLDLSAWIGMTVMMAEYTHPLGYKAATREDLQALYAYGANGQALGLDNWVIAIGHYVGKEQGNFAFRSYPYLDKPGGQPVALSASFRLGEVMVYAWTGVTAPPDIDLQYVRDRGCCNIWQGGPATEDLAWPPWLKLHDKSADEVAWLMRRRYMVEAMR